MFNSELLNYQRVIQYMGHIFHGYVRLLEATWSYHGLSELE